MKLGPCVCHPGQMPLHLNLPFSVSIPLSALYFLFLLPPGTVTPQSQILCSVYLYVKEEDEMFTPVRNGHLVTALCCHILIL